MDIDVYVIHDGDYGTAGAEIFNEPIMLALNDNSHLVVLDKCIEDVLNYPVTFSDKPLRAYSFISENWHQWSDISERWRDCIEKIFNNGHRIIIRMGEIQ